MRNEVFETVNEYLEKYIGGEIFFDELDNALKFNKDMLTELINNTRKVYPSHKIIASGEIALCLHNFGIHVDVIVQGSLRKGVIPLKLTQFVTKGERYIFVDDSYFSGKTANIVKDALEMEGCVLDGISVIYDGCREKKNEVISMYRYYDYN